MGFGRLDSISRTRQDAESDEKMLFALWHRLSKLPVQSNRKETRMKWIIPAFAIFVFALCGRGVADEASKQAAAEELMKVTNAQGQMEKTLQYLKTMPMGLYGSTNLTAALTQQRERMYSEIFTEKYWADIKKEITDIYAQIFTEEELKGIVDFYKSPAGQAFLTKQPEMMQRMMEFQKKKTVEILPRIQEISRQAISNMQSRVKAPEGVTNERK